MIEVTRLVSSPIGMIRLVATSSGLRRIDFGDEPAALQQPATDHMAIRHLDAVENQLDEYFAGCRRAFDLVLVPEGSDFQRRAWEALRLIPFGSTMSYADQARAMGRPSASRAVGGANGRNPLAIVVPCHRVVGSNGRLTGYASGIERKQWLLEHEARVALTGSSRIQ